MSQSTPISSASLSRGIAWLMLAVLFFVCQDSLAKYLTRQFPVMQIVFLRYVFHLVTMSPFLFWYGPLRVAIPSRPLLQIARSFMLLCSTIFFNTGFQHMPLATVTAIGFVSPLVVTALAALFLKEKVGPRRWAAVFVGFVGVLVVARPSNDVFDVIVLFPLAGAVCNALFQLLTRALAGRDSALTTIFWTGLVGCIGIGPAMPWVWQAPDLVGLALMAMYGVLGFSSHFTLILAYHHASASILAPFYYVQLVLAIIWGAVLFHNMPDLWTFVGVGCICGSGLYTWHRQRVVQAENG